VAAFIAVAGLVSVVIFQSKDTLALVINANVQFTQTLAVGGALSKTTGSFAIDHPLHPFTKILYHSFVESPKALNMYQGEVVLDAMGTAVVMLPDYFQALNTDFEYYLEPIGTPMPKLAVTTEIRSNSFAIGGGSPSGRVSWHVSGVRRDPFIMANPIVPEVEKTDTTLVKKGECLYAPLCE
jgi:hypothetical protein